MKNEDYIDYTGVLCAPLFIYNVPVDVCTCASVSSFSSSSSASSNTTCAVASGSTPDIAVITESGSTPDLLHYGLSGTISLAVHVVRPVSVFAYIHVVRHVLISCMLLPLNTSAGVRFQVFVLLLLSITLWVSHVRLCFYFYGISTQLNSIHRIRQ